MVATIYSFIHLLLYSFPHNIEHNFNNMKYRRLDLAELQTLEKDFVRFLASNHITAEDWVKIKKEDTAKMEGLLNVFSDIVWDKTLPQVQYLEFIRPHDCKLFFCDQAEIRLIGFSMEKNSGVDLLQLNLVTDLPELLDKHAAQIKMYNSTKTYQKVREQEIFDLLESGCLISKEGHLFQLVDAIQKQT